MLLILCAHRSRTSADDYTQPVAISNRWCSPLLHQPVMFPIVSRVSQISVFQTPQLERAARDLRVGSSASNLCEHYLSKYVNQTMYKNTRDTIDSSTYVCARPVRGTSDIYGVCVTRLHRCISVLFALHTPIRRYPLTIRG